MYQTSDWIKAISQLSKLTVQGGLKWRPADLEEDELPSMNDRAGRAFVTEHKDKLYQVFEVRTRNYTDEDTFYWVSNHYLDIFSRKSSISNYEFVTRSPDLPAVFDLWRTVEKRYAYQSGALDDLLGETDEKKEPE